MPAPDAPSSRPDEGEPPPGVSGPAARARVGIFIVAYNAESTLTKVLDRIPPEVWDGVAEVYVFDDASEDRTATISIAYKHDRGRTNLNIRRNDRNLGYGGNQKAGYRYAIERGYDVVVLLHGDGQYAPEVLPEILRPLLEGRADVVLGSRMMTRFGALRGGMPLYKYLGNRILSGFQNAALGARLAEYHSGYRAYAVPALWRVPFELNSDDFHFDTEILIQLLPRASPATQPGLRPGTAKAARKRSSPQATFRQGNTIDRGARLVEVPIPTYYGTEICRVNGLRYAWNVVRTTIDYRLQRAGLKRVPKYAAGGERYPSKLSDPSSSHSKIVARVPPGSRVLEVGCGPGHLGGALRLKGCRVTGVDSAAPPEGGGYEGFLQQDLDRGLSLPPGSSFDVVLLADVLEHLRRPADVLEAARSHLAPGGRILASTGNIGLWYYRLSHLLGRFEYAPRGVLDETHVRLYTLRTFRRLIEEADFRVVRVEATPVPLPSIHPAFARAPLSWLHGFDHMMARLWKRLFAYQFVLEAEPGGRAGR